MKRLRGKAKNFTDVWREVVQKGLLAGSGFLKVFQQEERRQHNTREDKRSTVHNGS